MNLNNEFIIVSLQPHGLKVDHDSQTHFGVVEHAPGVYGTFVKRDIDESLEDSYLLLEKSTQYLELMDLASLITLSRLKESSALEYYNYLAPREELNAKSIFGMNLNI